MAVLILPGTAGQGDVRSTKKFSAGTLVNAQGSLVDKTGAGVILTPGADDVVIPAGAYGGAVTDGKVAAVVVPVANVLSGTTIAGQAGTMPTKVGSATVITPSTVDQVIPQGYFGGVVGDGKVKGDANLVGANIIKTATIFNTQGTAQAKSTFDAYATNLPTGYNGISFVDGEGLWAAKSTIGENKAYLFNSSGVIISTVTFSYNANGRCCYVGDSRMVWNDGNNTTWISDKTGAYQSTLFNGTAGLGLACINDANNRVFGVSMTLYVITCDLSGTKYGTDTLETYWPSIFMPSVTGAYYLVATSGGNIYFKQILNNGSKKTSQIGFMANTLQH